MTDEQLVASGGLAGVPTDRPYRPIRDLLPTIPVTRGGIDFHHASDDAPPKRQLCEWDELMWDLDADDPEPKCDLVALHNVSARDKQDYYGSERTFHLCHVHAVVIADLRLKAAQEFAQSLGLKA